MAVRKVYVTKRATFEAAHHLNNYDGKCSYAHGHSYKVEVTFVGGVNLSNTKSYNYATEAMVCDFSHLKKLINEVVVNNYDHRDLNLFFGQPTAEVIAIQIFNDLKNKIGKSDFSVYSVKLWETEDSYAEYRGEYVD